MLATEIYNIEKKRCKVNTSPKYKREDTKCSKKQLTGCVGEAVDKRSTGSVGFIVGDVVGCTKFEEQKSQIY